MRWPSACQPAHLPLCALRLTSLSSPKAQETNRLLPPPPTPSRPQLFWEAFPAAGGRERTAYMFTYTDAAPSRPTFASLLDTYLRQLPEYQVTARMSPACLSCYPCAHA